MDFWFPGRILLLAPNLARLRPAAPPGAPTRPARGISGIWVRQVVFIIRLGITGLISVTLYALLRTFIPDAALPDAALLRVTSLALLLCPALLRL